MMLRWKKMKTDKIIIIIVIIVIIIVIIIGDHL